MNLSMVRYLIGWILGCEGILLILPLGTALLYGENPLPFFMTMAACLLFGLLLICRPPRNRVFYLKEGFMTTALSWVMISIFGALPLLFSGVVTNPVDALFETVSGFTTTGASILPQVENLPKGILFWRSFTHWIGGMGVLVFLLILPPLSGGGSAVNLMKAESPGPRVEKLMPTVRSTAKILYGIYLSLTVLEILFLLVGGMPVFDALTTSFGTAGTGGFGIKNDSMAGYSPYLQTVVAVFMVLFGVNFSFYFLLLMRKFRRALFFEEVRIYMIIILISIIIITLNIYPIYNGFGDAVLHSSFQVASIITTTGFSTVDFNVWPQVSKTILVMLMFVGACAGSTGGGIKVSRLILLVKTIGQEIRHFLFPHSVNKITMDKRPISGELIRSINVFMIAYILIFSVSMLLVGFDNYDLTTNFTAVAATLNNIGPGLEMVGPAQNFGLFSNGSKLILIFDMLAGRLEIFPLLILFSKNTWKKF